MNFLSSTQKESLPFFPNIICFSSSLTARHEAEKTPVPHLGLAQLPLGAAAVEVVQQLDAAPPGIIRHHRTPHQHLVPEDEGGFYFTLETAVGFSTEAGSLVCFRLIMFLCSCLNFRNTSDPPDVLRA